METKKIQIEYTTRDLYIAGTRYVTLLDVDAARLTVSIYSNPRDIVEAVWYAAQEMAREFYPAEVQLLEQA